MFYVSDLMIEPVNDSIVVAKPKADDTVVALRNLFKKKQQEAAAKRKLSADCAANSGRAKRRKIDSEY